MKERPILFSSEMIKAILEGRKTMTRRVIRFKKSNLRDITIPMPQECPYGKPGDRLWVRESYKDWSSGTNRISYRADYTKDDEDMELEVGGVTPKWRPSIFMPRWASRITLEITGIKVERLQEISEEEARREGIEPFFGCAGTQLGWKSNKFGHYPLAVDAFKELWGSINGKKYPWSSNPWVFVIEFSKVDKR